MLEEGARYTGGRFIGWGLFGHSSDGAFKCLPDGSPLCLPVAWLPLLASENDELLLSSGLELQNLELGREKRWKSHDLGLYVSFSFVPGH